MGYIELANFKFGLESRRSELTAQPGTLVTCENAHINQGGEIEKRKRFVLFANTAILDDDENQGVFGLEATGSALCVFGSANATGASPVLASNPSLLGLTYVQLVHPAVTDGATYDPDSHRMDLLRCSTTFGGETWAIARFTDGNSFAYKGTTVIGQWRDGVVLAGRTSTTDLAAQAEAAFNREKPDFVAAASGNDVELESPIGQGFSSSVQESAAAGSITTTEDPESAGNAAVGAAVILNFVSGTSGSISSITAPNGVGGTVELLSEAVAYSASLANTASLLAQEINDTVTSPKYTAVANGTEVTIMADPSLGDSVNYAECSTYVVVTHDGGMSFDSTGTLALTAVVSPTTLSGVVYSTTPITRVVYTSAAAVVSPVGGVSPYTYVWEYVSGSTEIEAVSSTSSSTVFRSTRQIDYLETLRAVFRCLVEDAATGSYYTQTVSIALGIENPL